MNVPDISQITHSEENVRTLERRNGNIQFCCECIHCIHIHTNVLPIPIQTHAIFVLSNINN